MAILTPTGDKATADDPVRPDAAVSGGDRGVRWRRVAVIASAMIAAGGISAGMGIIGMAINDGARGSFTTTPTLLNPAGFSFSIWTLIYLGLLAYVAWQMTSSGAHNRRAKSVAKLAALSMLLNAAWILAVQLDWAVLSLVVITSLMINLVVLVVRLSRSAPRTRTELLLLDGVFGLYLAWVIVCTLPNAAIVVHLGGAVFDPAIRQALAVAALLGIAAVGVMVAARTRVVAPVLAGLLWGTLTIGLARMSEPPYSATMSMVAFAASLAIAAAWLARSVRGHQLKKRA